MVSDSKIWKPVPSLNNAYEVSNTGEIRRVSVKTKLSLEDVDKIRSYREAGRSWRVIANEFGVSKRAIKKTLWPRLFSFRTKYRQLKPQKTTTGYLALRLCLDGIPRTRVMHRLIAEAFLGPIPTTMEVNHKNGKKTDNRVENLEIISRSANALHGIYVLGGRRIGSKGSTNPRSVLKESDVVKIRALQAAGHTKVSLAKQFGVSHAAIRHIVSRRTWAHV